MKRRLEHRLKPVSAACSAMPTLPAFWLNADASAGRLLTPLGALFAGLVRLRRGAYRRGILRSVRLPVPVIVVGNIFVGGTGKTPLVVWLVRQLVEQGYRPGVLVRGYGGSASNWPRRVDATSEASEVGDEAVLLARQTGVPVAAGPDRVAAGTCLVEAGCNVLVSDDGLQHYRLARDFELVVVDAERGLGSGRCLPAGPLREPAERLTEVDLVIGNGGSFGSYPDSFQLVPGELVALAGGRVDAVGGWRGRTVHAVAGIGNPSRFFHSLGKQGLVVTPHAFPDHHRFAPQDLEFGDDRPVIMTEKDAVKVTSFAGSNCWYQPVTARPSPATEERLTKLLTNRIGRPRP